MLRHDEDLLSPQKAERNPYTEGLVCLHFSWKLSVELRCQPAGAQAVTIRAPEQVTDRVSLREVGETQEVAWRTEGEVRGGCAFSGHKLRWLVKRHTEQKKETPQF